MKSVLLLSLALVAGPALAQFKCTGADGSVSFQQQPCDNRARTEPLALLPPAPDDGRTEFRTAAARGRVRVGMNRAEVDLAMRVAPEKVNRSVINGRAHDQLVYFSLNGPTYLYMEDDRLTSWQYTSEK